jgi:hypothetical protein
MRTSGRPRCGWAGFTILLGLVLIGGQVEGSAGVREKGDRGKVGHRCQVDAKAEEGLV